MDDTTRDTERFIHAMTAGNRGLAPRYWVLTLKWIRALPVTTVKR